MTDQPSTTPPRQYRDTPLHCRGCGFEFVWTAKDQQFYDSKGFDNPPVRCPSCRQARKHRYNQRRPQTSTSS